LHLQQFDGTAGGQVAQREVGVGDSQAVLEVSQRRFLAPGTRLAGAAQAQQPVTDQANAPDVGG
jgi:hypothetical protein